MGNSLLWLALFAGILYIAQVDCQIECPPFDPVPYMCCNGTINYKPSVTPRTCCGTKAFSTPTHMCCAHHVNPRPQGDDITPGCCGPMVLIHETQICCQVTVNPRPSDDTGCCAARSYDRLTQMCCQETVVEMPENPKCCGPHSYNEWTHKCCDNKVPIPNHLPCPIEIDYSNLELFKQEEAAHKAIPHKKVHHGWKHKENNH